MNNSIYGILEWFKVHEVYVISIGNYSEYKRYISYFLHKAFATGYRSKLDFSIYYYNYFYNPEWKTLSKSVENIWVDPEIVSLDMKAVYGSYREYTCPKISLATLYKAGKGYYNVEQFISPLDVWKDRYLAKDWNNKYLEYSYDPSIASFSWKRNNIPIRFHGRKSKYKTAKYRKTHTKHLRARIYIKNEASKVKDEYKLPCIIKHYKNPRQDYYSDLNRDTYSPHTDKSWKNNKFKHQYDHNLIYKSKHKHKDVSLSRSVKDAYGKYHDEFIYN